MAQGQQVFGGYANLGVGTDKPDPDVGRYAITKDPRDWGVFKTPTLREIEHTAPYVHDGSLQTLEGVVDFYDKGGSRTWTRRSSRCI